MYVFLAHWFIEQLITTVCILAFKCTLAGPKWERCWWFWAKEPQYIWYHWNVKVSLTLSFFLIQQFDCTSVTVKFVWIALSFSLFDFFFSGEIGIFDHLLQNSKKFYDDVLQQGPWDCRNWGTHTPLIVFYAMIPLVTNMCNAKNMVSYYTWKTVF